jgi:glutathione gamma-glutamylcysteinyltransferase/glutathione-S-conjugate glycine hydrolase
MASSSSTSPAPTKVTYLRRELPPICTSFGSVEGKELFMDALQAGTADIFFPVSSQFHTQAEPAYCALGSLVTTLNALEVDPRRTWKGPWRFFSESMLDCCEPLEKVKREGMTFDKVVCVARCNGLSVKAQYARKSDVDSFRADVLQSVRSRDTVAVVSYSRKALEQTGDGHFSPIGAYSEQHDSVLIMDVARFKLPPHWVKLPLLFAAMSDYLDSVSGLSRGWMVCKRLSDAPRPVGLVLDHSTSSRNWQPLLEHFWLKAGTVLCGDHTFTTLDEAVEALCALAHAQPDIAQVLVLDFYKQGKAIGDGGDAYQSLLSAIVAQLRDTKAFELVAKHSSPLDTPSREAIAFLLLVVAREADLVMPKCAAVAGQLRQLYAAESLDGTELDTEVLYMSKTIVNFQKSCVCHRNTDDAKTCCSKKSGAHGQ